MAKKPQDQRPPQIPERRRDDLREHFRKQPGRAQEGEQKKHDPDPIEVDRVKPEQQSGE